MKLFLLAALCNTRATPVAPAGCRHPIATAHSMLCSEWQTIMSIRNNLYRWCCRMTGHAMTQVCHATIACMFVQVSCMYIVSFNRLIPSHLMCWRRSLPIVSSTQNLLMAIATIP